MSACLYLTGHATQNYLHYVDYSYSLCGCVLYPTSQVTDLSVVVIDEVKGWSSPSHGSKAYIGSLDYMPQMVLGAKALVYAHLFMACGPLATTATCCVSEEGM